MAQQFSRTDQRRITFLSLLSSAAQGGYSDQSYEQATEWLAAMESDGFFTEERSSNPTPQRSERSARPASNSRPSNRGRDQQRSGGWNGQMRDPDGPPSDRQVDLLLELTDDYTEREIRDMTKQDVSNLITELK